MPLVKVKEKFQITLPAEVRRMLHVAVWESESGVRVRLGREPSGDTAEVRGGAGGLA